jgi:hypothetical protein
MYEEYPKIHSFIQKYGQDTFRKLANLQETTSLGMLLSDIKHKLNTPEQQRKIRYLEDLPTEKLNLEYSYLSKCYTLLDNSNLPGFPMIDIQTQKIYKDDIIAYSILIDEYLSKQ